MRLVGSALALLLVVGCAPRSNTPDGEELGFVVIGGAHFAAPAFVFDTVGVLYTGTDARRLRFEVSPSSGGASAEGLMLEAAEGARAIGMIVEAVPNVRLGSYRAQAFRAQEERDGVAMVRFVVFAMPTPWRRVSLLFEGPAADYGDGVAFRALLESVVLGPRAASDAQARFGVGSIDVPALFVAEELVASGGGHRLRVALGREPRRLARGTIERGDDTLLHTRVESGDESVLIVLSPSAAAEDPAGADVWDTLIATLRRDTSRSGEP